MTRVVFSRAKEIFVKMLCIFLCLFFIFSSVNIKSEEVLACSVNSQSTCAHLNIIDLIKNFFSSRKKEKVEEKNVDVYLGGCPLGFTLECDGVMVVAIGAVQTLLGDVSPCENKNIRVGDIINSINKKQIESAEDFQKKLQESGKEPVELLIYRGEEALKEYVLPALEDSTNHYRLGLWIRDNSAGVGTLTYIREDNLRFGALGHPVTDIDTNKTLPVRGGNIFKCSIVGVSKGTRGIAGELRGLFLRNGEDAGEIDSNNEYGVYGTASEEYISRNKFKKIQTGSRNSVKTGKATILCTIDGTEPKEYDIEIVKLSYQPSSSKKSMVIKVTDPRLIEKTGGIVQGMSGSPIIQNQRLVGAVTHVFLSDPTKGFGVYIDWMIDN